MANTQEFVAQLVVGGPPGPQGPPGPAGPAGASTPWASDVDAAGFQLQNASRIGAGTGTPNYPVDVIGDVNITGNYRRSGVALSISIQDVVTGSRAANTVYQNTTGKTLYVMACWNLAGQASTIRVLADAVNPPTVAVAQIQDDSNQASTIELFFMVLPDYFYQCSLIAGAPTLVSWVEYR